MREPDPLEADHGRPAAAVPEVRRPRQQPRLLHGQPARDRGHQPRSCTSSGIPQIMYNQHQTGPAGTVMFCPPFRDPFNYNFDPLVPMGIDLVGPAMHKRFVAEGKPGATMRSGASATRRGGTAACARTAYFHNMIGILTEIIGNPTPMDIPLRPRPASCRNGDYPDADRAAEVALPPVDRLLDDGQPGDARLRLALPRGRSSSTSTSWAGTRSRAARDNWTVEPKRHRRGQGRRSPRTGQPRQPARRLRGWPAAAACAAAAAPAKYLRHAARPGGRDPRGYIIPSDQPDFLTATKFVNALIKSGIAVHRATRRSPWPARPTRRAPTWSRRRRRSGRTCSTCSSRRTTRTTSPIRAARPGRRTTTPAGRWPSRWAWSSTACSTASTARSKRSHGLAKSRSGKSRRRQRGARLSAQPRVNDAFIAVNRLLKAGEDVYWLKPPFKADGKTYPAGTIYIPAKPSTAVAAREGGQELGVTSTGRPRADRPSAIS